MVTRAIGNAQQKVEVRNFGIRKHLLEYDDVMNQQRQVVYDIRNQALSGEDMRNTVEQIIEDYVMDEIDRKQIQVYQKYGTGKVCNNPFLLIYWWMHPWNIFWNPPEKPIWKVKR